MSVVKITNLSGQVVEVDQNSLVFNDFSQSLTQGEIPTEGYMVVAIAAANGLKRTALVPVSCWHDLITALQAHDAVLDAHDALLDTQVAALAAMDTTKQDKLSGTTAQYVRGNGTLATFPTIPTMPDITGKSDKANFTALSTLAAHGRSNGATSNPTNSPTDAPTNYGVLAAVLGADVNANNTKQNTTAANCNTIGTNLNALAVQFNALLTWLGLSKDAINNLRAAGAA